MQQAAIGWRPSCAVEEALHLLLLYLSPSPLLPTCAVHGPVHRAGSGGPQGACGADGAGGCALARAARPQLPPGRPPGEPAEELAWLYDPCYRLLLGTPSATAALAGLLFSSLVVTICCFRRQQGLLHIDPDEIPPIHIGEFGVGTGGLRHPNTWGGSPTGEEQKFLAGQVVRAYEGLAVYLGNASVSAEEGAPPPLGASLWVTGPQFDVWGWEQQKYALPEAQAVAKKYLGEYLAAAAAAAANADGGAGTAAVSSAATKSAPVVGGGK